MSPPTAVKLLGSELPEISHTLPSLQVSDQSCATAKGGQLIAALCKTEHSGLEVMLKHQKALLLLTSYETFLSGNCA